MKNFTEGKNNRKVRDHYHYTGKYKGDSITHIGQVHNICNLRINVQNEVAVVFHNGSNYDDYFIIKELAN